MRNIVLTVAVLLTCNFLQAQDSVQTIKEPVRFQSILQAGLLLGESASEFEMQSINGIKWKTFSTGIGVGIDNYVFRTIPLFIDIRTDILKKQNTPFVFADAGTQFSWVQDNQKMNPYLDPEYKGGFYFNAGAGYKINIFKRNSVIFSAAFSLKKVNETETVYCDFSPVLKRDTMLTIIHLEGFPKSRVDDMVNCSPSFNLVIPYNLPLFYRLRLL